MAYPICRVVRPSIALRRPLVFCATWGVTFRSRRSATQPWVSYPLSAARVRGLKPRSRAWSTRSGTASRSAVRSEEHTSELQSRVDLVCRLLLEQKKHSEVAELDLQNLLTLFTSTVVLLTS